VCQRKNLDKLSDFKALITITMATNVNAGAKLSEGNVLLQAWRFSLCFEKKNEVAEW
jgi:hypothetical protein